MHYGYNKCREALLYIVSCPIHSPSFSCPVNSQQKQTDEQMVEIKLDGPRVIFRRTGQTRRSNYVDNTRIYGRHYSHH